jgi:hypothetical protein
MAPGFSCFQTALVSMSLRMRRQVAPNQANARRPSKEAPISGAAMNSMMS